MRVEGNPITRGFYEIIKRGSEDLTLQEAINILMETILTDRGLTDKQLNAVEKFINEDNNNRS